MSRPIVEITRTRGRRSKRIARAPFSAYSSNLIIIWWAKPCGQFRYWIRQYIRKLSRNASALENRVQTIVDYLKVNYSLRFTKHLLFSANFSCLPFHPFYSFTCVQFEFNVLYAHIFGIVDIFKTASVTSISGGFERHASCYSYR